MVRFGVVEPGNIRPAITPDFQFKCLNAQLGHTAVLPLVVCQQGGHVDLVNQAVRLILHRGLRDRRRVFIISKAGAYRQTAQVFLLGVGGLTAVQQVVTDYSSGIGAELGGGSVIGGRSPAEGKGALLAEIIAPQAVHTLVGSDMAREIGCKAE